MGPLPNQRFRFLFLLSAQVLNTTSSVVNVCSKASGKASALARINYSDGFTEDPVLTVDDDAGVSDHEVIDAIAMPWCTGALR